MPELASPRTQELDKRYITDTYVSQLITIITIAFEVIFWWEKVVFLAIFSPIINWGRVSTARYYARAKLERDHAGIRSLYILGFILTSLTFVSLMMGIYNNMLKNANDKKLEEPEVILAAAEWTSKKNEYQDFLKSIPYTGVAQLIGYITEKSTLDEQLESAKQEQQLANATAINENNSKIEQFWNTLYKCEDHKGKFVCFPNRGTMTANDTMHKNCDAKPSPYGNGNMTSAAKALCLELNKLSPKMPDNDAIVDIKNKLKSRDYVKDQLYWHTLQEKDRAKTQAEISYYKIVGELDKYENLDLLFHLMADFINRILLGYTDIGPQHATMIFAFFAILGIFKYQNAIEIYAIKSLEPLSRRRNSESDSESDSEYKKQKGVFGSFISKLIKLFKRKSTEEKEIEKRAGTSLPKKRAGTSLPEKPPISFMGPNTKPKPKPEPKKNEPTKKPEARKFDEEKYDAAVKGFKKGDKISKIAEDIGVAKTTAYRYYEHWNM